MVQAMAREFAQSDIRPIAAEIDREARFPHETVKRMGELGLMGIAIPETWGGAGSDTVAYVVALEEIAKACASHAVVMSVNNSLYCDPVYKFGTDAQRERFLRPVASGHTPGCFALTEAQAGSDARNQNTLAVRDGAGYVITGRKQFISTGREASFALVFAQTDRDRRHHGITAFVVEKGTRGFTVSKTEDKLGIRASDTAELVFDECRVPAGNRIGEEGQGFTIAMTTIDGGRIGIAAQAVGIAQACLDASIKYAKERQQFGRPIADFQAIQWKLAEMATDVDAATLLIHRAARLRDAGVPHAKEASMAKLFASTIANKAANEAVQIHGGAGYCRDFPVERYFRDAKITEIYEGTSEAQRMIIAKSLLK